MTADGAPSHTALMALDLSLVGKESTPSSFTYAWKDVVLYALGIGAKKDELDFLYEGRGPKVIPSVWESPPSSFHSTHSHLVVQSVLNCLKSRLSHGEN